MKSNLNEILLKQAKEAPAGVLTDHSQAEPFYRTRLLDFDLQYSSVPANAFQVLIEEILTECIDYLRAHGKRKNQYSKQTKKELRGYVRSFLLNARLHEKLVSSCQVDISVSLDKRCYGNGSNAEFKGYSYARFRCIYDALTSKELAYFEVLQDGFVGFGRRGSRTRIVATDKLLAKINRVAEGAKVTLSSDPASKSVIELRDTQKKRVNYKHDASTRSMERKLRRFNKMLSKSLITLEVPDEHKHQLLSKLEDSEHVDEHGLPYIDYTAKYLKRIFNNNSFEQGGRFYCGWWQSVPSDFRQYITIDGQPTVELDYSKLHPTLLYRKCGVEMPEGFDPYQPDKKMNRAWGKQAWNSLLNSGNPFPKMPKDYAPESNNGLGWKDFLQVLKEYNKRISKKFGTGYGVHMQYTDSGLAESVMQGLLDEGVICLPIHDSFIVKEEYEPLLRRCMFEAANGFGVTLQVDAKH